MMPAQTIAEYCEGHQQGGGRQSERAGDADEAEGGDRAHQQHQEQVCPIGRQPAEGAGGSADQPCADELPGDQRHPMIVPQFAGDDEGKGEHQRAAEGDERIGRDGGAGRRQRDHHPHETQQDRGPAARSHPLAQQGAREGGDD
jgi:hypothetical protein